MWQAAGELTESDGVVVLRRNGGVGFDTRKLTRVAGDTTMTLFKVCLSARLDLVVCKYGAGV